VRKDYERREGQIDVKKKIEYSKQLNASRIKVLQTQEDMVHGILDEVRGHVAVMRLPGAARRSLHLEQVVCDVHAQGCSSRDTMVFKSIHSSAPCSAHSACVMRRLLHNAVMSTIAGASTAGRLP
jgi:ATP synthase (E/31 kDa) subunit